VTIKVLSFVCALFLFGRVDGMGAYGFRGRLPLPAHRLHEKPETIAEIKTPGEALAELGIFSIFLRAMHQADLHHLLDGTEKMTILAPTDHGFAHMSSEQIESMLAVDNKPVLHRMLSNHLVVGVLKSHDLVNGLKLHSFNNQDMVLQGSVHGTIKKIGSVTLLPSALYQIETIVYGVNGLITDEMLQACESHAMEFSFDDVFDFEYHASS
jgi:hypothetical protein